MKHILLIIIAVSMLSGGANNKYVACQQKIKSVQSKIHEVDKKINDLKIEIDTLGFVKNVK